MKFIQNFKQHWIRFMNLFLVSESLIEAKAKWNTLAQKDARYYILTNTNSSSEAAFRDSGKRDVEQYFANDSFFKEVIDKKSVILEIGCGIGRLSEFIAPNVGRLYAVDISEEMIARAKSRVGGSHLWQLTG